MELFTIVNVVAAVITGCILIVYNTFMITGLVLCAIGSWFVFNYYIMVGIYTGIADFKYQFFEKKYSVRAAKVAMMYVVSYIIASLLVVDIFEHIFY